MSVYKRGNTYWYDFVFNGERQQGSCKTRNRRTAETIEAKKKTDLALGYHGLQAPKPGPTLKVYAEGKFTEYIKTHNKKRPRTIGFYLEKIRNLLKYKTLEERRIGLIDEALIQDFIEFRIGQDGVKKVATVNRDLAALRRILHVARDVHKLIIRMPKISMLPGETERDYVLSQDLEKIYLVNSDDTLRDFAILALDTGVRETEGVSLEWDSNVFFEPLEGARFGHIFITESKSRYGRRRLPMTPRVRSMLKNRRRFYPDDKYVFPSPRKAGCHLLVSSLDHRHHKLRAELLDGDDKPLLPTEFVLHSLRHTFGTRLGESGADAFSIMKIMGHSSVTVSQKYVHPTPANLEIAFERMNAMNEILRGGNEAAERLGVPAVSTTAED